MFNLAYTNKQTIFESLKKSLSGRGYIVPHGFRTTSPRFTAKADDRSRQIQLSLFKHSQTSRMIRQDEELSLYLSEERWNTENC
jgi:hypothetical protein